MKTMANTIIFMTEAPEKVLVKKFVSLNEGKELYSMGGEMFCRLAEEAGAVYKIGKRVIVNTEEFEHNLEQYRL